MFDVKFNTAGSLQRCSDLLISLPEYQDAFNATGLATVISKFGRIIISETGNLLDLPVPGETLTLVVNSPDNPQLDQFLETAARTLDLLLSEFYKPHQNAAAIRGTVSTQSYSLVISSPRTGGQDLEVCRL
ncbi:hypothetical protein QBC46DRAFT_434850 [Diplogelasinospora grovesii]|uniref:Uncharacterized protein n=1 Tax=Diplogelasinospora grovesii TaxID=303347 RepID=A0AAN6RY65_9PEZI|nr:hypothetical protein QBC46DRAFT_434850 [Diplogelasinospora grovesii]